jgi:hypothetical protein
MNHKLLMGYQGWFSTVGDGSAQNSWVHWFGKNNTPTAANAHFDFWPDTSELDADEAVQHEHDLCRRFAGEALFCLQAKDRGAPFQMDGR